MPQASARLSQTQSTTAPLAPRSTTQDLRFYESSLPKRVLLPGEVLIKAIDTNLDLDIELEQILITELLKEGAWYVRIEVLEIESLTRDYTTAWFTEIEKRQILHYELMLRDMTGDQDTELLFLYLTDNNLYNLLIFKRSTGSEGPFLTYQTILDIQSQNHISPPLVIEEEDSLVTETMHEDIIAEFTEGVNLLNNTVTVLQTRYHFDTASQTYSSTQDSYTIRLDAYNPPLVELLRAPIQEFVQYLHGIWTQRQADGTYRILDINPQESRIQLLNDHSIESLTIGPMSKTLYNRLYFVVENDIIPSPQEYIHITVESEDRIILSRKNSLWNGTFVRQGKGGVRSLSLTEHQVQQQERLFMAEQKHSLENFFLRGTFFSSLHSPLETWIFTRDQLTITGVEQDSQVFFWSLIPFKGHWILSLQMDLFGQATSQSYCLQFQQEQKDIYQVKTLLVQACTIKAERIAPNKKTLKFFEQKYLHNLFPFQESFPL